MDMDQVPHMRVDTIPITHRRTMSMNPDPLVFGPQNHNLVCLPGGVYPLRVAFPTPRFCEVTKACIDRCMVEQPMTTGGLVCFLLFLFDVLLATVTTSRTTFLIFPSFPSQAALRRFRSLSTTLFISPELPPFSPSILSVSLCIPSRLSYTTLHYA